MRILLVDDDDELAKVLEIVLTRANHNVSRVRDGNEALKILTKDEFDLILTDLIMAEKDGLELLGELHATNPKLKVIAMSGGGSGPSLAIAKCLGARLVLSKPFSNSELLVAIDSLSMGE